MAARRGAQAGTDAFEFAREEPARAPAAQAVAYAEVALNKPLPREY
jgi:hypothetical protein